MSADTTEHAAGTFAALGPAIEALVYLQATYPHLPHTYIVIRSAGRCIDLSVGTLAGFETWRVALQIPAGSVDLHVYGGDAWLKADTTVRGVSVELAGHGCALPESPTRPCGCTYTADRHLDDCRLLAPTAAAAAPVVTSLAAAHGGAQ